MSTSPLTCEICGRPYKTERGRLAQVASVHGQPEAPPAEDFRAPSERFSVG